MGMTKVSKAKGRTLAEFEPLLPAEKTVLAAARNGEVAWLGDGERPEKMTEECRLRPDFVCFLALGGDDAAPVHEKGVWIRGGWIDGDMDCQGAVLPHDLVLWVCRLDGDLILRGATTRTLALDGTRLKGIEGDRLTAGGGVFLRHGFHACGEVCLRGAHIGGDLECTHGQLQNQFGNALSCEGFDVRGSVLLNDGFQADGTVNLLGARVAGGLNCLGGKFHNPKAVALDCSGATIDGFASLCDGFCAAGMVSMHSSRVGRDLICAGGRFDSPELFALMCDGAQIMGSVFLRDGFHASGQVRFNGARINGNLECDGGVFQRPTTNESPPQAAFMSFGAKIGGTAFFRSDVQFDGLVDLTATQVGSLFDDKACWPQEIALDGFRYDRFADAAPVDATTRIRWLDRQSEMHLTTDFKPQPWEQLIKVLREMGHHHAARDIAIEKQNRLRRLGKIRTPLARGLHWAFGALAGYGYRPLRPVRIAFGVWLGFALIYHLMAGQGVFGPSNPLVFDNPKYAHCRPDAPEVSATGKPRVGNWVWCADSPGEYAAFSPMAYSLDLILPVISLGQANEWGPITPASAPDRRELQRFGNLMFDILKIGDPRTWEWLQNPDDPAKWREFLGLLTRFLVWFEILVGWVFSGLLVAVLSGLAKKDDA